MAADQVVQREAERSSQPSGRLERHVDAPLTRLDAGDGAGGQSSPALELVLADAGHGPEGRELPGHVSAERRCHGSHDADSGPGRATERLKPACEHIRIRRWRDARGLDFVMCLLCRHEWMEVPS